MAPPKEKFYLKIGAQKYDGKVGGGSNLPPTTHRVLGMPVQLWRWGMLGTSHPRTAWEIGGRVQLVPKGAQLQTRWLGKG